MNPSNKIAMLQEALISSQRIGSEVGWLVKVWGNSIHSFDYNRNLQEKVKSSVSNSWLSANLNMSYESIHSLSTALNSPRWLFNLKAEWIYHQNYLWRYEPLAVWIDLLQVPHFYCSALWCLLDESSHLPKMHWMNTGWLLNRWLQTNFIRFSIVSKQSSMPSKRACLPVWQMEALGILHSSTDTRFAPFCDSTVCPTEPVSVRMKSGLYLKSTLVLPWLMLCSSDVRATWIGIFAFF